MSMREGTTRMRRERAGVRRKRRAHSAIRALRIILITVVTLGLAAAPAPADSGPGNGRGKKLAPDLVHLLKKGSPADTVRLVAVVDGGGAAVAGKVEGLGGRVRRAMRQVGQMALELPLDRVEQFGEIDGVQYVIPDRPVQGLASHIQAASGALNVYPETVRSSLDLILSGYGLGYDGSGVGVAVIDSGIQSKHVDLRESGGSRVLYAIDFVDGGSSDDFFGHGSHVAGIIAGSGKASQLAGYDFAGIAPRAHLVDLRVLDRYGRGRISDVIAAIDFAIAQRAALNIRVINLSLAAPPIESHRHDPLCQAAARAASAGIVVVAAAGNFGLDSSGEKVYGGIPSPAISPAVITVGAADTGRTHARSDDRIAPFSSRGPTRSGSVDPATGEYLHDNLPKPDLVAPGLGIVSLENAGNTLVTNYPALRFDTGKTNPWSGYMTLSGTSMSAGVVSGAVALMLQANPALTPNQVRAILMYTAQIMDGPDLFEQGAGLLNADGAVLLAAKMKRRAGELQTGENLLTGTVPDATSTIAGEPVAWSQGLIWWSNWVTGTALIEKQQEAYAQGLIWGFSYNLGSWSGTSIYASTYSDDHVVYGSNGTWQGVAWDGGTSAEGVEYHDDLASSGVYWENRLIDDDFFTVDASGLIWNWYLSTDQGLIWSYNGGFTIWYSGLIWTLYF